ncbi:tyrosine decarboxylase MfnA [Halodesulfurarchaeum sp. HSR-GB]|uniref:tyrosine decarboxylase MfnA n=1 Tax=Halodesulfurarchaeum sp. HSR-GB TaxID=3074077 RepID=UPI00285A1714|nr:tyrosine decarboxylase MfnA [Halodesulfurarchaeum sp. HSR-GB]MDR5656800.1 tyrosine decarboxylase MfnA [Halodesulfurarchaeum sp. HSR-GB]
MTPNRSHLEPQSFDRVLSSMCTEPAPAARRAAMEFLGSNPGDPATFQAVAARERETVSMLGELAGLADPHGYVTAGGSEANIQAVRAARNRATVAEPNVVAPTSAHFSLRKAASLLDVELRLVETGPDHRADPAAMADAADERTALVFGVAGSTEYGRVDPIPALVDLADSVDAMVHVDAAFGGFLLPFTDREWHFGHAEIDTMTIDPHKAGRAAIPAGGFLVRDRSVLDALSVETPYLESESQVSLGGTRSGAGVASAHAALETLWPDGYRAAFERTMKLARWLATALDSRGFTVAEPELPLVAWEASQSLFERLREAGWRIARTQQGAIRIVVMPHVDRNMLEAFLAAVDRHRP